VVLTGQIRAVVKTRLLTPLGELEPDTMWQIEQAFKITLRLPSACSDLHSVLVLYGLLILGSKIWDGSIVLPSRQGVFAKEGELSTGEVAFLDWGSWGSAEKLDENMAHVSQRKSKGANKDRTSSRQFLNVANTFSDSICRSIY